jgi:hypothetical protein
MIKATMKTKASPNDLHLDQNREETQGELKDSGSKHHRPLERRMAAPAAVETACTPLLQSITSALVPRRGTLKVLELSTKFGGAEEILNPRESVESPGWQIPPKGKSTDSGTTYHEPRSPRPIKYTG